MRVVRRREVSHSWVVGWVMDKEMHLGKVTTKAEMKCRWISFLHSAHQYR
jgi:hypothetical protein